MPFSFVAGLRACGIAFVLALAALPAAEPAHPLLGVDREEVLNRYGEPRSQLSAGGREVWIYPRERLVLIDGRVAEVEPLAFEPARRTSEPAPPSGAPVGSERETPAADPQSKSANAADPAPQTSSATPAVPSPPAAEPKLEIKRVRPPSEISREPVRADPAGSSPSSAGESNQPSSPSAVSPDATREPAPPPAAAATSGPGATPAASTVATAAPSGAVTPEPAPLVDDVTTRVAPAAAPAPDATKSPSTPSAPTPARAEQQSGGGVSPAVLVAGGLVLAIVALLVWRARPKYVPKAAAGSASKASVSPLSAPKGTAFSAPQLQSLDARQFESLVAAYYNKTGVVATRANHPPGHPVHLQISWKGESRPFALVHCAARPAAPVDVKPLQDLHGVLTAEGIRRGYVVTSGSFNPAARDFAEEKHLTLLPGETFLEKLNALPEGARAEVMQALAGSAGSRA